MTALPEELDYRDVAERGEVFEARLALAEVPRVAELACDPPAAGDPPAIHVRLQFFEDEQRWAHVSGRVEYAALVACDRCLAPFNHQGGADINSIIVASDEQAAGVPRQFEPTIAEGGKLDPRSLIGDEILLALPQALHCDRSECRANYEKPDKPDEIDDGAQGEDRWRPFANLR
ncbi:hypothetical protein HKX42_03340 [Salinisphaera sp. USBA-960]|uniref:YceD family protein n=1 Tax=Salinisphaera orenii TaxID=856731 RepID=UPI000DBE5495|nr:hypothetical protein [Salifodinibacter halophilus]NNC25913.1 hypothetical protein [Salifodinibacter halophilus]